MDAIDLYIDALAARLRLGPTATRRFLTEAQDHLREAVAREMEGGVDIRLAEQHALERFGTPRQVARAANGSALTRLGSLTAGLAWLAALGCVTVVAGTLLAWVAAAVTSTSRVFGLPVGYQPSAARVAHWVAVQPGAHSWHAAAAAENADDSLLLRGIFAVAGLAVCLVVVGLARRRLGAPPAGVVPAMGAAVFGGAGVLLLLGALMNVYTPVEWGRGLWLSDAVAALLAALLCVTVFVRDLRTA